jgi:hypothetical protein
MDEIMVTLPHSIVAGETLCTRVTHPTATAVKLVMVGPDKKETDLTAVGTLWSLAEDTTGWPAGAYAWQLWSESPGGRCVLGSGRLQLAADLSALEAGADTRSTAEKNVEALEAMLGGNANLSTKRYRINNRELEKYSITELMQLLDYWKGQVRAKKPRRDGPHLRVRL